MLTRLPYPVTALFAAVSLAIPVLAAADTATDAPTDTKSLDTVIVTGTRASNRTEAESLSPIDVITPDVLSSSGASNLATALNRLLPSLDFPHPSVNDGNDALRPATLRGLSPDDVLVLVDGKRWHTSALINYNTSIGRGAAPVDLNSIPMAAIDHIEVLRDGASAQYGSDAIAGVINIVLKHGEKRGDEITANLGKTTHGDGAQNGIDGSYALSFGPKDAEGKSSGWVRLTANYQNEQETNRAGNPNVSTAVSCTLFNTPNSTCAYPYERYGEPAAVTKQALVNFGFSFSPDLEAYGYVSPSRRDVTSNGFYRSIDWPNRGDVVTSVYPEGFLPQIINHTNDINSVLGLRGTWDGWHWDASVDYGKNHLVFDLNNTINVSYFATYGYSPTYFNAGTFSNSQTVASFDASKDFSPGFLPNPLTFSWGVSYRHEAYDIRAGEPDSYFYNRNLFYSDGVPYTGSSQVYPGLSPSDAGSWGRHSEAAYIDFETNFTDKLSAGFAARYEDYSDAGSTLSGKLSGRYQLTEAFAIRGTLSNGFRAPSLAQENYTAVSTIGCPGGSGLCQVGTFGVNSAAGIALGAKPLNPETSENISLGAVWQPTDSFSSTLDIYQIKVNNEVVYTSEQASLPADLAAELGVSAGQFFVNGADIRARGADWVNTYKFDLDHYGELTLTGSLNFNKIDMLAVKTELFGLDVQQLQTRATPRTKFVFSADWQNGPIGVSGNLTRYGTYYGMPDDDFYSITNPTAADALANSHKYPSRWVLGLTSSYKWDQFTFTLGVDNVFNTYPQKILPNENTNEANYAGFVYSALSPFGFTGRYIYGKVNYKF